ncbi:MAG: chemotaxis protein, partial [Crocosphaera sp.]
MQTPVKQTPNPTSNSVAVNNNPSPSTNHSHPISLSSSPTSNPPPATVSPLVRQFSNLSISGKTQMITALIFLSLGGLIALGSTSLVASLRSQLLEQAKFQLGVTELNYNRDLEEMGLGFASQAENPTIIEAAKTISQGQSLSPEIRTQV